MLWFLACAVPEPEDTADDPAGSCSLTVADGTEACPIDPCAACGSVAEGLACCLDRHGMGAAGSVTVEPSGYCASEETYDPSEYWSEDAARCAAQVYGLRAGIDVCFANLVVCDGGDRAEWSVMSLTEAGCGWWHYRGKIIDARDGTLHSEFVRYADGICED